MNQFTDNSKQMFFFTLRAS